MTEEPLRVRIWSLLFTLGVVLGLVGLPALVGFMAGARIDEHAGPHPLPFRLLFVSIGVGVGGLVAWARRPSRLKKRGR